MNVEDALKPGSRTFHVRGFGVAAVVAVGVAVLAQAGDTALTWAIVVATDRARRSGDLSAVFRLDDLLRSAGSLVALAEAAALAATIVWLWRARRNLDAFPGREPGLGAGWAIGGWFLPIANAVIPARVMTDVARLSCPGRRVGAVAVFWWLALLTSRLVGVSVGNAAGERITLVFDAAPGTLVDIYRQFAVGNTVALLAALVAAAAFAVVVTRVSVAQEERIHRGWYEARNRVMGVTPPAGEPDGAGGGTIRA